MKINEVVQIDDTDHVILLLWGKYESITRVQVQNLKTKNIKWVDPSEIDGFVPYVPPPKKSIMKMITDSTVAAYLTALFR